MSTDISRRDALKTGAALVTGPVLLTVHAAADVVKFGVIGLGVRGSYLVNHLARIDAGRCVALCDLNPQTIEAAGRQLTTNPRKYQSHHDLLADKDVEAVFIAVPPASHFELTRDALLAGKHVFCEPSLVFKPLEVHSLRSLAAEHSKQILQVGLQRRSSLYFQSVKRMIDQGILGTVTHIHAQWHSNPGWLMQPGGKDNPRNWRLFRESSGGLTSELAVHQIDVANWFFGATPEFVIGVGGLDFRRDGRDVFDNIQLIYSYPNGRKMVFSSITTCQHLPILSSQRPEVGLVVMGTAGAVELSFGAGSAAPTALWFREPEPSAAAAPQIGVPIMTPATEVDWKNDSFLLRESKMARRWLFDKGILLPQEDRSPAGTQLESFLSSVRGGVRPYADIEVGLINSTAVILSNIAMEENRRVAFMEIEKMGIVAPTPPPAPPVVATADNPEAPALATDFVKSAPTATSTKPAAAAKKAIPRTAPKAAPKVDPNP
jgi:predicted dehydrogenase